MTEDELVIRLSRDQAIVLSDWLYRMVGTPAFDDLVNRDRAVWSPLHRIAGTLETTLTAIFAPDYVSRLDEARERLVEEIGDMGRPAEH